MTAKDYLNQLRRLDMMIDQKLCELDDLRSRSMAIESFDYSKERVQTSPDTDARYAGTIQKIADLEKEIDRDVDKFINAKHRIVDQIQDVEDQRYADLLYKRYVEYKAFQTIEEEMHYSHSYTMLLHRKALQEFEITYPLSLILQEFADTVEKYYAIQDDTQ